MAFQGDLFDFPLPDLLWFLGSRNKSGWLTLVSDSTHMVFTFRQGKLVGARSTDSSQRLGTRLVDAGLIDEWQVKKALEVQKTQPNSPALGSVLIELGFITSIQLERAIARQFGELVFRLLIYPTGQYRFDPGIPDMRGETVNVSIESEVFEAVRRADEWSSERMLDTPFKLNPAISSETAALIDPEERIYLVSLIRGPKSLDQLVEISGRDRDRVLKSLHRLQASGVIYLDAKAAEHGSASLVA
ncbi:MAG: DUF4388 domain-containing protein [Thermomicrobiales bacterium]